VSESDTQLQQEQAATRMARERLATLQERIAALEAAEKTLAAALAAKAADHASLVKSQLEQQRQHQLAVDQVRAEFQAQGEEARLEAARGQEFMAIAVTEAVRATDALLANVSNLEAATRVRLAAQEHRLAVMQGKVDAERRERDKERELAGIRAGEDAEAAGAMRLQVEQLQEAMHTAACALKAAHTEAEMWSNRAHRLKARVADAAQVYTRARNRRAQKECSLMALAAWRWGGKEGRAAARLAEGKRRRCRVGAMAASFVGWRGLWASREVVRRCFASMRLRGREGFAAARCLALWRESLLVRDELERQREALQELLEAERGNNEAKIDMRTQTHRIQTQLMQQTCVMNATRRCRGRLLRAAVRVWWETCWSVAEVTSRLLGISSRGQRRLLGAAWLEFKRLVAVLQTARRVSMGKGRILACRTDKRALSAGMLALCMHWRRWHNRQRVTQSLLPAVARDELAAAMHGWRCCLQRRRHTRIILLTLKRRRKMHAASHALAQLASFALNSQHQVYVDIRRLRWPLGLMTRGS